MAFFDKGSEWLKKVLDGGLPADEKTQKVLIGAGVASAVVGAYLVFKPRSTYKKSKSVLELGGGGIKDSDVASEFDQYAASYGEHGTGEGIKDRSKTVELVNTFYNLVTDIYEWGWGASFHFSPKLPGRGWIHSEVAHEARLAAILGLKPGKKCLDVGCGVGGPMRTIAAVSGADVLGITINDYQVSRVKYHMEQLGMSGIAGAVQGDYLKMSFPDEEFDAAYAIESTCHAAKLEEVYAEVNRVLKPGGLFASYEWVSTKEYDPENPVHKRIMDEINFGNGLPEMRTWKQAEEAGKKAGFVLLESLDLAVASPVTLGWYKRLDEGFSGKSMRTVNASLVNFFSGIGLAPKGLKAVHDMLMLVAVSLVKGGETGIFTPMHLLVFQKPLK